MSGVTPWLTVPKPRPAADSRLVCFPHAGGSASLYRAWAELLAPSVELQIVQYPGRANRRKEALIDSMGALTGGIAEAVAMDDWAQTHLFGHSMGAAVAFEVARALEAAGRPAPRSLFVSERSFWPTRPDAGDAGDAASMDARIEQSMADIGGQQAEVFQHPELRAMFLPVIRNDFRLMSAYTPVATPRISTDIVAIHGDRGNRIDESQLSVWSSVTTGEFHLHSVQGNHFYLVHTPAEAVAIVHRHILGRDAQTTR